MQKVTFGLLFLLLLVGMMEIFDRYVFVSTEDFQETIYWK